MIFTILKNRKIKYLFITIIWLAIWEIVSLFVHNNILIVGPFDVVITLIHKCGQIDFYKSIGMSMLRIIGGFITGLVLGVVLGILSWKIKFVEDFLNPVMSFIKAAPVASFVVLFLIWWHSNILAFAICVCVSLPQIYISVLQGFKATDKKIIEVGKVFNFSTVDKINYIYRPYMASYLEGALKIAVGLSFKAGVAAEVIGTPENSIGNELYFSKIYLDTAGVLAWTAVIIVLSVICEKIFLRVVNLYFTYEFNCRGANRENYEFSNIKIENVSKMYDGKVVLNNYSKDYNIGQIYKYDWPSGEGKTTLLKIIAQIEEADSGNINPKDYSVSMVFQEDRLIEDFSAITNVNIVCGNKIEAKQKLLELLSDEDLYKPVRQLSGGQRRRVAIARALVAHSNVILFDEPYEGLDEDVRRKVSEAIIGNSKDKVTIIASHINEL